MLSRIKDTYQSVKNLSCGVLSIRNPTFQFPFKPYAFCQLEFADLTSLCLIKGLDASPLISSLNVEEVNVVKHLNLQSRVEKYDFQSIKNKYTNAKKYEFQSVKNKYTNPSYLAGLPSGKKTMSIVGGHTSKYTNFSYFVETMNLFSNHRQAEGSYLLPCFIT